MKWRAAVERACFRPVDAASLAAFRFGFGALLAASAFGKYVQSVERNYAPGRFHFTYPFFDWVQPWPWPLMQVEALIMGVAAFSLMIGYRTRLSAFVHFLTYSHIFFVESTQFNNHFYLIILLSLLFSVTDSGAALSFDRSRRSEDKRDFIPAWQLYLFRFQLVVVYFYGGIAKLNPDWLQGEPMRQWLFGTPWPPAAALFLHHPLAPWFFSYGGLIFDLSIGFLLLIPRTRYWALIPLVFFHLTNSLIFSIGVFPWLALASTVVFLAPDLPRRALARVGAAVPPMEPLPTVYPPARGIVLLLLLYAAFQCLMPLRHFVYPGQASWNEFGHLYSWHMKLRDKMGALVYVLEDPRTGGRTLVGEEAMVGELTLRQYHGLVKDPPLIIQYAQHLGTLWAREHGVRPRVYAISVAGLNGRPLQTLVKPDVDLMQIRQPMREHAVWLAALDATAPLSAYPTQEEANALVAERAARALRQREILTEK